MECKNPDKGPMEVYVPLWKQRLFEMGIAVVIVILVFDMFGGGAPFALELMFVGLAVLATLLDGGNKRCVMRLSSDELKIMSPAMFGRGFTFERDAIDRIEESGDIFKTWKIHLNNGSCEEVLLRRVLGVAYSRATNEAFRRLVRESEIPYSRRN